MKRLLYCLLVAQTVLISWAIALAVLAFAYISWAFFKFCGALIKFGS